MLFYTSQKVSNYLDELGYITAYIIKKYNLNLKSLLILCSAYTKFTFKQHY